MRIDFNDHTFLEQDDDGNANLGQFVDGAGMSEIYLDLSDRSALLLALLEAEAGEVVDCEETETHFSKRPLFVYSTEKAQVFRGENFINTADCNLNEDHILCLARAIQEQRKREAEVSGE